ncbi:MAG: sugar ABC transporter substrate-binding protein [Chloroflexota bacterium]
MQLQFAHWQGTDESNALAEILLDEFNQQQTRIDATIKWLPDYERTVQSMLAGEDSPDLLLVDLFSLPELVEQNLLEPLQGSELDMLSQALRIDLFPELVAAFTVDEYLYCIPREFTTLVTIYHKGLFDVAAVPYPHSDWNWAAFQSAARQITESPNEYYSTFGVALNPDISRWLPFLYQAGGTLFTQDPQRMAIDSSAGLTALDFYLGLHLEGYAVVSEETGSVWTGEALGKERVGMIIEGSWALSYLDEEFPSVEYGIAPLPRGGSGRSTVLFGHCIAISAQSQNQREALTLLEYLSSVDVQTRWQVESNLLPARMSLQRQMEQLDPRLASFYAGADYAVPWRLPIGFERFVDAVNTSMKQVLDAEITTEEVLRVGRVIGDDLLRNE